MRLVLIAVSVKCKWMCSGIYMADVNAIIILLDIGILRWIAVIPSKAEDKDKLPFPAACSQAEACIYLK